MAKQQVLLQHLTKAKFFSLLLDWSTDKGNIDNQDVLSQGESTTVSYSKWPFPSVGGGGVTEPGYQARSAKECKKLVGVGTDGAASNIAASGLKGLVEGRLGWFFWV